MTELAGAARSRGAGSAGARNMRNDRVRTWAVLAGVAGAMVLAGPAGAVGWEAGGHLLYAEPRGDFAAVIERGFGIQGYGVLKLDPLGIAGIRLDGGLINYGNEKSTVPLSNTVRRVLVEVNTSNNIAMVGIGPQLSAPSGPVRPYAYAAFGLGYFFTESSVKGTNSTDEAFASSTNFDDTTPSVTFGGGLQIPVANIVAIDFGVEYRRHRQARYLTEGDIVEEPDGSVTLLVNESDADLMVYRLGVAFIGGR
jgi:hypothetical protein